MVIPGFFVVLIGVGGLLAQPTRTESVPPAQNVAPPKKEQPNVWFFTDSYQRAETPQGNIISAKGGIILRFTRRQIPPDVLQSGKDPYPLTNDDSRLTTATASFNEKTQIANAPGKLKLEDTYNTLTGNTGTAFYKTRDARIRGDVVIVARPRDEDRNAPEGSTQRQFDAPVTMTCQKVDYNWRTRIARASDRLTVKQKDYTVTADQAFYDGKKEMVILEGNVKYTRTGKPDTGQAKKVTIIYTKGKENFIAEGGVSGVFAVDEDAEKETEGDSTPRTPPAPAPGESP
jgi:lipopolysaccharide export system protein LptA